LNIFCLSCGGKTEYEPQAGKPLKCKKCGANFADISVSNIPKAPTVVAKQTFEDSDFDSLMNFKLKISQEEIQRLADNISK
jgi:hypothetical protein